MSLKLHSDILRQFEKVNNSKILFKIKKQSSIRLKSIMTMDRSK